MIHIWWLSGTFILQGQTKEIICQCTGEEMVVLNAEQMSEMQLKKRLIPRRKQVCWRILVRVWRMITYLVWQRNRKLSTLPVLSLQSCSKSTYHGPFTLWNTTTTPNVRIKERDSEHQKPSTKLVQEFGNHMWSYAKVALKLKSTPD